MKGRIAVLLFSALGMSIFGTSLMAQEATIRLAVVGVENPSTFYKSNIGNSLVDQLTTEISAVGKYKLLERSEIGELRKELNLGESGVADPKTFAQKGGLTGADFLLLGKVSQYSYEETTVQSTQSAPGAGVQAITAYDHIALVRLDLHLTYVKTGEVVRSFAGEGRADVTGAASWQAEWGYYSASQGAKTFADLQTLLTQASNKAIQHAVEQLDDMESDLEATLVDRSVSSAVSGIGQGKILANLGQGRFVIGVPSTAELKVGDRFHVIAEVPLRNTQGEVVYQERREIGTLQVTDVSQSDRALASLIDPAGPPGGGPGPGQGDVVVFDQAYGRSLRVAAMSGGAVSPGAAAGDARTEAENYIRRGDLRMNQHSYGEGLEQYKEALRLQPNNPEALAKKSTAEVLLGDLSDAEDDAAKAIAGGAFVTIPVDHVGFICSLGTLTIGRGRVTFQPSGSKEGFTVTSRAQLAVFESTTRQAGSNAIPALTVRWTDGNGKWRKYDMVSTIFLAPALPGSVCSYVANGDAADKTERLHGMIMRLINANLR